METVSLGELILRLGLAAGLGASIGVERELRDQSAGFRTHLLVSLGAALFTIAGAFGVESLAAGNARIRFDPTRVAAQVVTGIGFLGAGAIIREGLNIRGLTTAAAMWVTAAIGTAVGLGFYAGAVVSAVITIVALFAFKLLKTRFLSPLRRDHAVIRVTFQQTLDLAQLVDIVERKGARIDQLQLTGAEGARRADLSLQFHRGVAPESLVGELANLRGVSAIEVLR